MRLELAPEGQGVPAVKLVPEKGQELRALVPELLGQVPPDPCREQVGLVEAALAGLRVFPEH